MTEVAETGSIHIIMLRYVALHSTIVCLDKRSELSHSFDAKTQKDGVTRSALHRVARPITL